MFKSLFKSLKTVSMYRKTYNELSALSDYELRDIGISRGEIHDIASEAQKEYVAKTTKSNPTYKLGFEVHP
jgi:uncharacterized protein YjiS (DUF1127 family)